MNLYRSINRSQASYVWFFVKINFNIRNKFVCLCEILHNTSKNGYRKILYLTFYKE